MTVLFYLVNGTFTKSYFEALKLANGKCKVIPRYAEFTWIDNLEDLSKVTVKDIVERYEEM